MGLFDGIVSAGLGIVGDILGGESEQASAEELAQQQFEHQKELARIQNEYNVENYKHRHRWEVSDLRAAGLNPILSANSAGSVAAAGQGSASLGQPAHKYDFGKSINNMMNSALMKKQIELAEFNSQTERIKADADMLRARNDEARTPSAISLAENQSGYLVKQTEMLDKNYELQKLYNEAQVREIDQKIINSVMEVQAKVKYYEESGRAAIMTASAHQASAAAAMRSAAAQEIIAQVAEQNGISQRQLNDALSGKASAETVEAYERAAKINSEKDVLSWQMAKDKQHNPFANKFEDSYGLNSIFMGVGEILRNGISGGAGFMP